MSQVITIRTNSNQATPVVIPDMGIEVPALAAVTISITTEIGRQDARVSDDLRVLATDGAGGGADGATGLLSTIILTDGANAVGPADVDSFLSNVLSELGSAPYEVYGTNGAGAPAQPVPGSEIVRPFAAGVLVQDAVYQRADGVADRADASGAFASMPVIGFVRALNEPGAGQARIVFAGDLGGFAGLVAGKVYVMGAAPGTIVADDDTGNPNYPTTTSGSGHIMQEVGVAQSATVLFVGVNRDYQQF